MERGVVVVDLKNEERRKKKRKEKREDPIYGLALIWV